MNLHIGLDQEQEKKLSPKKSLQEDALALYTMAQGYGIKYHKTSGPASLAVSSKKKSNCGYGTLSHPSEESSEKKRESGVCVYVGRYLLHCSTGPCAMYSPLFYPLLTYT